MDPADQDRNPDNETPLPPPAEDEPPSEEEAAEDWAKIQERLRELDILPGRTVN